MNKSLNKRYQANWRKPKLKAKSQSRNKLLKSKLSKLKRNSFDETVSNICKVSKILGSINIDQYGKTIAKYYTDLERVSGSRYAVSQLKALYSESVKYSCRLKVEPLTPKWLKRDKENFPLFLTKFKVGLRSDQIMHRRMTLTLLRAYECVQLPVVPNMKTVTDPSNGSLGVAEMLPSLNKFFSASSFMRMLRKSFIEENQINRKGETQDSLSYSTKSGVRGPTCATAGYQSLAIDEELMEDLEEFNKVFRNTDFREIIEENQEFFRDHNDLYDKANSREINTSVLGKISFIPAPGGKTRLVALGNYWIQESFKELHKVIYSMLKKLATDGTYFQNEQFTRVLKASSERAVWSFDLTAATDRFPIEFQYHVLKSINTRVATLWNKILQRMEFLYDSKLYSYAVGQPMGLYSSWAVFALSHHVLIQYAAWLEGFKSFNQYTILGDDVAIWNKTVALRYRELLDTLCVEVSEHKSFYPESDHGPCIAEFAKRISDKGVEVSALSPTQINDACRSFWNWNTFGDWLSLHGFDISAVPASRIADILDLSEKNRYYLFCSLYIWEVLKAKTFVLGIEDTPESITSVFTKDKILRVRVDRLVEQASGLWSDLAEMLDDFCDPNREALEERLGGAIPDKLYFYIIIETRLSEVVELEERMAKYIPSCDEFGRIIPTEDSLRVEKELDLGDIEYLPIINFKELSKGLTQRGTKNLQKAKLIRALVKDILALT